MNFIDWGQVDYTEATRRQLELAENFQSDSLIFCRHPSVVTIGRGTKPGDLFAWTGEVHEVSRGGRATYHGPGQVVVYPILDLTKENRRFVKARDLHSYLRALENSIVEALGEFGLQSEVRTVKADLDSPSLTGVWIHEKKIASIGIAVKKWITYHGLAINFDRDEMAYRGIHPCGFQASVMTSVAEVSKQKIERHDFQNTLKKRLQFHLE